MIQTNKRHTSIPLYCLLGAWLLASACVHACTIFVLTDTNRVLFCNNEDCDANNNIIWFIPAGRHRYGCAYVGQAGNQWAQGGLNAKGLAFDWVAGFNEKWSERYKDKETTFGNPAARMLQTCSTVQEAVAFFRTHKEPSFSYAKILVADRSGTSAIIGAKDGVLQIEQRTCNRGFGYGHRTLATMMSQNTQPTTNNAFAILAACRQGKYGTKYSNVYDLKLGEIYLVSFPDYPAPVSLNLDNELKKGRHLYNMTGIKEQLGQKAKRPSRLKEWAIGLYCWFRWTG